MRLYYTLTNVDPLIISQTSATTNNHLSLDHIPGSAILGALASQFYAEGDEQTGFALFQTGACRFGPAYPVFPQSTTSEKVKEGEIALPTPAAWHTEKHDATALTNHVAPSFQRDDAKQYKQRRNGYITHQNQEVEIEETLTTRTALEENASKVADGQLFTYATIKPGHVFAGWIDVDDEAHLDILRPLLQGDLYIGRSRSGEFGRVTVQLVKNSPQIEPPKALANHRLVLWCLSDVALVDENGLPTLSPQPQHLHPELTGALDAANTFVRHHKVRRFNRARGGFDSEQQLLTRGSVLSFVLDEAPSEAVLKEIAEQGIGMQRQHGLGWVAVNPSWVESPEPASQQLFAPIRVPLPQANTVAPDDSSLLIKWVVAQQGGAEVLRGRREKVVELCRDIYDAYRNARSYNNIAPVHQAGPSRSQWERLNTEAKNNAKNWQSVAFEGEAAICKAKNDELGWGLDWQQDADHVNFSSFAKTLMEKQDAATLRLFLEELCRYDLSTYSGLKEFNTYLGTQSQGDA